ncbi:MAG TPA: hypothetical protein VJ728_02965 [Candidatus Binataceae bacterium]|nr:hypothetical protein [Candidatus Binataceae bacterium]
MGGSATSATPHAIELRAHGYHVDCADSIDTVVEGLIGGPEPVAHLPVNKLEAMKGMIR